MKDELYIDIVSKTIIKKLSDEIVSGMTGQANDLLRELLRNEVSDLLKSSNSELKRYLDDRIENYLRTERLHAGSQIDTKEIKNIREEVANIRETLRAIDKTRDVMEKAILQMLNNLFEVKAYIESKSGLRPNNDSDKMELLRRFMEVLKTELTDNLTTKMEDKLLQMEKTNRSIILEYSNDIKKYISENIEKYVNIKTIAQIWRKGRTQGD
ncbi:MAG: hypothetical protein HQL06_14145 [Nitrospirae bacterium]|nr:hypothetical protein [Nitrospirota bacterium]